MANLQVNVLANLNGITQIREAFTALNKQIKTGLNIEPIALSSAQAFRSSISQATIAVAGLAAAFTGMTAAAIAAFTSQESAFAGVRKTFGEAGKTVDELEVSLRQVQANFTALSNRIPVPFQDLSKIAELAGQLGVEGVENVTKFTETIARVAASSKLSADAAASGLAKIANAMQEPISNVDRMAATMVGLAISTVSTEQDIINFAERIAGVGKLAGMTTADIFGISAAFASVGIKAEAGGTSIQKMISTMTEAVAIGGEKLTIMAELIDVSEEKFKELFKADAAKLFGEVISGIARSGDRAFGAIAALGGANERLTRSILTTGGAGDKFNQTIAAGLPLWEANNAHIKASNERFKTFESSVTTLKNAVNNLAVTFGETLMPALRPVVDVTRAIVIWFQTLSPEIKTLVAAITAITAGLLIFIGIVGTVLIWVSALRTGITNLGTTAGSLIGLFGNIGKVILLAAAAIYVLVKAYEWWTGATDTQKAATAKLEAEVKQMNGVIAGSAASTKLAGDATKAAGEQALASGEQAKAGLTGWRAFVAGWREAMRGIDVHINDMKTDMVAGSQSLWDDMVAAWGRGVLLLGDKWTEWSTRFKQEWNAFWSTLSAYVPEAVANAATSEWDNIKKEWDFYVNFWADKIAGLRKGGREAPPMGGSDPKTAPAAVSAATTGGALFGPGIVYDPLTGQAIAGASIPKPSSYNRLDSDEAKPHLIAITEAYEKVIQGEQRFLMQSEHNFAMGRISEQEALDNKLKSLDARKMAVDNRYEDEINLAGRLAQGESDLRKKATKEAGVAGLELLRIALDIEKETNTILNRRLTFEQSIIDQRVAMEQAAGTAINNIRLEQSEFLADLEATDFQRFVQQEKAKARPAASKAEADLLEMGATLSQIAEGALVPWEKANAAIDDFLKKDYRAATREIEGLRAATGLLGVEAFRNSEAWRLEGKAYNELTDAQKRWVDQSAIYLEKTRLLRIESELLTATIKRAYDLYNAGMSAPAATMLAARTELALKAQKDIDHEIQALNILNNHYQTMEKKNAQLLMERGQNETDFYKFSIGSLKKWAAEQDTIWQAYEKMLVNTLGHVTRTLSDLLYNVFTGKEFKMKDMLKDLLDSMLREIANFMAAQAVKAFMNFMLNLASGQSVGDAASNTLSGALGQGTPPAGTPTGTSTASGNLSTADAATKLFGLGVQGVAKIFGWSSPATAPPSTPGGSVSGSGWQGTEGLSFSDSLSMGGGSTSPDYYSSTFNSGGSGSFSGSSDSYYGDYSSSNFAEGGRVPGSGHGDIIPAMLEPGEFVVRRSVAEQLGPTLERLNGMGAPTVSSGRLNFATGGSVPVIEARSITQETLLAAILAAQNRQTAVTQTVAQNTGQSSQALTVIAKEGGVNNVPAWIAPTSSGGGGGGVGRVGSVADDGMGGLLSSGFLTNSLKTVGGTASGLGFQGVGQTAVGLAGIASLVQGLQSGNPYLATTGGLTTAGAITGLLSQPGVAKALGLTPAQAGISGIASQGFGAATGVVNTVQGIQQGNYLGAAAGGTQTLSALANIAATEQAGKFLGYATGPYAIDVGGAPGTLGGAFGAVGGGLGVVSGGLGLYQGIQTGNVAQMVQGGYNTVVGASAISGAFGGPTITSLTTAGLEAAGFGVSAAAGTGASAVGASGAMGGATGAGIGGGAATGVGSAATVAAGVVGYVAVLAAIAFAIWQAEETKKAEQAYHGALEGLQIRRDYAAAVPLVIDALHAFDALARVDQMPPSQRLPTLQTLHGTLAKGWEALPTIYHFIQTKGVGHELAISKIGRANTEEAQALLNVAQPILAAGMIRVQDGLAVYGQQTNPSGRYDIAGLLGESASAGGADISAALASGQYAGQLAQAAPGNFGRTITGILTAANPNFAQSEFGKIMAAIPEVQIPAGANIAAIQQQMAQHVVTRQQTLLSDLQTQGINHETIMAAAPYVQGGARAIINSQLPLDAYDRFYGMGSIAPDGSALPPEQVTPGLLERGMAMGDLSYTIGQLWEYQARATTNTLPGQWQDYGGSMATGGPVLPLFGRAEWGQDTEPRMLEPGEWVIPRQAAKGKEDQLDTLVRTGRWSNEEEKPVHYAPMSAMGASHERAEPVAQGPMSMPVNVNITINGDVKDARELAAKLVIPIRDELARVSPRFSRAGNKTQG